ncbi:MAG TPA: hypothetical protein VKW76_13255 [Candidatus Binatia bacterium]|nr:hypothetical protein [Candidatus Binatia bacterium]
MRRAAARSLLAIMVVTGACAPLGGRGGAAQGRGLRRFYLTKKLFSGDQALTACARGYHMASRFEIADVSVLDYDVHLGLTTDDSGSGPPSGAAAYDSPGPSGWVRTGGASRFSETGAAPGSALVNCAAWSTGSAEALGTVAYLGDRFSAENGGAAPAWSGGPQRCNLAFHVWCVEDDTGRRALPSGERNRHAEPND